MVRRDGSRIRCLTRNGYDWADRFSAIVDAASRIKATSFLLDGEAPATTGRPTSIFHALRSRRRGHEVVVLYAFDLLEHDGDDLRNLPLIERKRRLAKLLAASRWPYAGSANETCLFFRRCIHQHASAIVRLTAW